MPDDVLMLKITQDHIERGKRLSNTCCPIALSFNEHFGESMNSPRRGEVFFGVILYSPILGVTARYRLDDKGVEFIERFDGGKFVKPTTLKLTKLSPLDGG